MQPHILGVCPARGGSRRVPKKNIKMLGGKPLIAWTIQEALKSRTLDFFLVSTDSEEIAKISTNYGAPVPFMRPAEISEDVDTVFVLQHAVNWYEKEYKCRVNWVVCLQPTSPFRNAHDIDRCVELAHESNVETVLSYSKTQQHPYWCFTVKPNQRLESFMDVNMEGDNLVSQNLPITYYPNGAVYVTKRDVIMNGQIYGRERIGYYMPRERSIDLEEAFDFLIASATIQAYGDRIQNNMEWPKITWVA